MANYDDLSSVQNTQLTRADVELIEVALGERIPTDLTNFLMRYGYSSFINVGFGALKIGQATAAFGQFYGKRPNEDFNILNSKSSLRIGDQKSHYPPASLVFAGDELGGEYFIKLGDEEPGIYWMIYGDEADFVYICENFQTFFAMIEIQPYDD